MHTVHTNNEEKVLYDPSAIMNAFNNSLSSPVLNVAFTVKGIYERGKGVNYNRFYYDILKDEYTDTNITLVVAERLRLELKGGQTIQGTAYLSKRFSTTIGRIDLVLTLTDLHSRKDTAISEQDIKMIELIMLKAKQGYKDSDYLIKTKIYQKSPIKVVILIGTSAIIDNDIKHQLKDAIVVYDIKYIKVNLNRPADIIEVLKQNDGADILVLSRGGGENIRLFDNLELAQQAINLKSIFIAAIGHAADEPLLQKVADRHFITPTALGQYFLDMYNRALEELNDSKAKLISDLTKQIELNFQNTVQTLNSRVTEATNSLHYAEKNYEINYKNLEDKLTRAKIKNKTLLVVLTLLLLILIVYVMTKK